MTMRTQLLIDDLKMFGCDYEFYSTTTEIIEAMHRDMVSMLECRFSLLDIGAGNGKVFTELKRLGDEKHNDIGLSVTPCDCYAVEKSPVLLRELPDDVCVVGTDFFRGTIIDKRVDVVFTNPPYKIYEDWLYKVLREANCRYLYFVVPRRWQKSALIHSAIEARKASFKVLGSFDFEAAEDRKARAFVELVRVDLCSEHCFGGGVDPFELWFDENFSPDEKGEPEEGEIEPEKTKKFELINSLGLVDALVLLYEDEMAKLLESYKKIMSIDSCLLKEIGVSRQNIVDSIKFKIKGLKNCYWDELFSKFDKLTSRLTEESRGKMLSRLTGHSEVDFNASNIHFVLEWAIRNANKYYDTQLESVFVKMLADANTVRYKSNKRVFSENDWQFHRTGDRGVSHIALDLRVVLSNVGGLKLHWFDKSVAGISERAEGFINDLVTVANNLGFACDDRAGHFDWTTKGKHEFWFFDPKKGKECILMDVRAFKNGNVHIKFNQSFIRALNVEMGRLKGWVQNPRQASEEMDIPLGEAGKLFGSNYVALPNPKGFLLDVA